MTTMTPSENEIRSILTLLKETHLLLSGAMTERDRETALTIVGSAQTMLNPDSTGEAKARARVDAEGVVGPQQLAMGGWFDEPSR
jgi:hypothetical protein